MKSHFLLLGHQAIYSLFSQEVSQATKMKQYAKPTAEENARCKVCFKKFGDGEFFKLCCSCERKVCDDCSASYGHKNTVSF
mgnify:CR=1 FL=1